MLASPPIEMANIGMADTIILMILALVVFGPRRLPQIGRQIGKLMYEFRKASNDFKFQMEEELRQAEEADRRKKQEEARQRAEAAAQPVPQAAPPDASVTAYAVPPPVSPAQSAGAEPAGPYPSASSYPDAAAGTTQPVDPTAAAVEAARLRIQPPTTGETVATNRPGAVSNAPQPTEQNTEREADSNHAAADLAASNAANGANKAEGSEQAFHG